MRILKSPITHTTALLPKTFEPAHPVLPKSKPAANPTPSLSEAGLLLRKGTVLTTGTVPERIASRRKPRVVYGISDHCRYSWDRKPRVKEKTSKDKKREGKRGILAPRESWLNKNEVPSLQTLATNLQTKLKMSFSNKDTASYTASSTASVISGGTSGCRQQDHQYAFESRLGSRGEHTGQKAISRWLDEKPRDEAWSWEARLHDQKTRQEMKKGMRL